MLRELTKVEQRYDAVLAVIRDGASVKEVAMAVGVSRQTVHAWLARYEQGGLEALADRSHRARTSPLQMPASVEEAVLEFRRIHAFWDPAPLRHQLERQGIEPLPSISAIYRCLLRHHLIEERSRRKRLPTYKRWERGRPMELWQMDVVGGILLEDGTECKVLTGIDDHSRFCVCAGVMVKATARAVCGFFAEALERHGVPEEILTDNGKVFTNRFGLKPTEVLFDKICRENGITHRLTAPASPTTTGKVERFHRTLCSEFLMRRVFPSLEVVQKDLDVWVLDFNTQRPHGAQGMRPPIERFSRREETTVPVLLPDLSPMEEERSGDDWIARLVSSSGTVSVNSQLFTVGKNRYGTTVDIRVGPRVAGSLGRCRARQNCASNLERGGAEEERRSPSKSDID